MIKQQSFGGENLTISSKIGKYNFWVYEFGKVGTKWVQRHEADWISETVPQVFKKNTDICGRRY